MCLIGEEIGKRGLKFVDNNWGQTIVRGPKQFTKTL